eukprot:SAG22_NODE_1444_length_4412_cov_2.784605_4_plen_81_part_00
MMHLAGVCYNNIGNDVSALDKCGTDLSSLRSTGLVTTVIEQSQSQTQIKTAAHGSVGAIRLLAEAVANAEELVAKVRRRP